jgi:hypothetical protein
MDERWKAVAIISAVLLLATAVSSSANLVTYTDVKGRYDVMVMEESGANVREVYSPTLYASGNAITPQQSDGSAWIAFMSATHDLYKIPADGLEPASKLLCNQGQYIGEDSLPHPYLLSAGFPTWSPDGGILLLLLIDENHDYFHALLDPGAPATGDCLSDLQPIPYDPPDSGNWELIPSATWNDDGSKIAFLEAKYDANDWVIDVQLAILENGEAGWTTGRVPMTPVDPNVEVPWNLYRSNLDWQRGGDTLAFSQRTTDRTTPWLYWVNATTGDWGPMTIDGVAVEGHAPTWSPDGTTLMYSNAQFKLVTRTYLGSGVLGGPETVVGSGGFADWQRDALLEACVSDAECEDGNLCTTNLCSGGACTTVNNAESCDDGNPCTHADVCSDGSCSGTDILDGYDSGCDGWCCDGSCWKGASTCEPEQVDCAGTYFDKKSCNSDILCRWDNRNGVCVDN